MSRKPSNYWEKRSTSLMLSLEKDTQYTINDLIKIYEKATNNIDKEIETIFKNYSKNNVLDKKVLKQLLNKKETDTHYKNLLKVINTIEDEDIKKKLLKKYNAPAYSYRISRLQALQNNIDIEMKKLADLEQTITEARYVKTIDEAYNHTIFDIQQGTGVGFNFSQLDADSIRLMLAEKWIDNQNFSQRIWKNTEKLGNYLKINLTADTMSGKSIQKISRDLASYMNVGIYNATTLVRTEVNHFANESEALGYEECEIEKYQFIATLDNRTCDRCGSLDNKIFNIKDRCSGENYPPLHPNDRCTTVAYFDDETEPNLQRRAKNENGKYIKVPANMNYSEWKEKYINKSFKDSNYLNNTVGKEYGDINFINNDIENICDDLLKKSDNNTKECIALIDSDTGSLKGKIYTQNKIGAVNFSIEQDNILKMSKDRSLIVVHNHPSNSTFSPEDIYKYIENKKISGIIVTTKQFNYFLNTDEISLKNSRKNIIEFKKWFEFEVKEGINKNKIIDNEIYNQIYKNIFERIDWNYGRKRRI